MYRTMPVEIRPMPLEVSSLEFVTEWHECWVDHDHNAEYLYRMALPFFDHWQKMLLGEKDKDISYITMYQLIQGRGLPPDEAIRAWIYAAQNTTSILEELTILFFEQLRTTRYYPSLATPIKAEYVIARDFKRRLAVSMAYAYRHPIDIPEPGSTFESIGKEDQMPDYLLIKNLGLDPWESYLLDLVRRGLDQQTISSITHIPRETFYYEERGVWQKLKQMWSSKEL